MRCYAQFVTTPSADTPGTLLLLHFDNKRYLLGQVGEGTQRACIQRKIGLRKVSDILLTGRTEWKNLGGMLGLVLNLADIKGAQQNSAAAQANEKLQIDPLADPAGNKVEGQAQNQAAANVAGKLNFLGAPNLNHIFATARRFIFRTGMPVEIKEFSAKTEQNKEPTVSQPTWQDKNLRVWVMPIMPSDLMTNQVSPVTGESRKRSHDEMSTHDRPQASARSDGNSVSVNSDAETNVEYLRLRENIVSKMFGSNWRYDALIPQKLAQVRMPATVYLRDPITKGTIPYSGPMPGGDTSVPNMIVLVREPWPGALTESLPRTVPAKESICYIIRNHPQRGKFMPEKAEALDVLPVSKYNELSRGLTVKNIHGRDITPDMVLEPGTPGSGFALVDLPDASYIESLVARPEWRSNEIMEGVEAIVWILGSGIAAHPMLRKFQEKMAHLSHVISAPDQCDDILSIESAVNAALRNHQVHPNAFPKLFVNPPIEARTRVTAPLLSTKPILAERGLAIGLQPKFEVKLDKVVPRYDANLEEGKLKREIEHIMENAATHDVRLSEGVTDAQWSRDVPFGDVEIMSLGTGSSHPSTHRNVSGTLVRVPGSGSYLLDAGEGTLGTLQRLFAPDDLKLMFQDLKMIWISHLHADHHLGTASVIKAWYKVVHDSMPLETSSDDTSAREMESRLAVVSDAPMLHWLREYSDVEDFGYSRILPLATRPATISEGRQVSKTTLGLPKLTSIAEPDLDGNALTAAYLQQMQLQSLETVFVNHCRGAQAVCLTTTTGFKVSYSGDARPSAEFAIIGSGSHVLIHEATFEDEMRSEAVAKKHSTAGEAVVVAHEMNAKLCILTHFSQRYPTMPSIGYGNPSAGSLRGSNSPTASANRGVAAVSLNPKEFSIQYKTLIEDGAISRSSVRYVTAFDYMRVKLKDIPALQKKQPLLKEICDALATKIINEEDEDADETEEPIKATKSQIKKDKKKQAKIDKKSGNV